MKSPRWNLTRALVAVAAAIAVLSGIVLIERLTA
jgi:hypothetical protein